MRGFGVGTGDTKMNDTISNFRYSLESYISVTKVHKTEGTPTQDLVTSRIMTLG